MRWTSCTILTTLMALTSCAAEGPEELHEATTEGSDQALSPTQGLLTHINAGQYGPTGETLTTALFDPYFTKPKAYAYPFHPPGGAANGTSPRWICPANQPCVSQAPGTGYYNLLQDRIASDITTWHGQQFFPSTTLPAVTSFNWAYRPGGIIADLRVSNTHLPQWNVPGASSPYAGLQLNLPSSYPGGMPLADRVPLASIRYIHIRMRAVGCKPPFAQAPYSSGRISYYASFGVPEGGPVQLPSGSKAMELAFNLMRFASTANGQWPTGGIVEPGRARWECPDMNLFAHPTCSTPTIDIDGPSWGISGANDLAFSTSTTCTTQSLDSQPWRDYVIDVPRALLRLFDEGFVTMDYLQNATYAGGILGGIEFFGPAAVGAQVARHSIHVASNPLPLPVVLGDLRAQLTAADPGFLAGTSTFVYRKTLSFDGTTCPIGTLGSPCDDTIYGKICQSGGDLLRCGNGPTVNRQWNWLGSAAACSPSMTPGTACSQPGQGCLSGSEVITCSSPPYQGPLYPGAPGLAEGFYQHQPTGNRFYYNGTNAFCWFLKATGPGGEPVVSTTTSPAEIGAFNAGRCVWDN